MAAWSRTRPTRATGDRLRQLVTALGVANRGVHHDEAPAREAVVAAYTRTCVALKDLFGPVSERLAGMDDLLALEHPGPADVVRLCERLGDGHPLTYLFDRAIGPGWLHALRNDRLLRPPPDGPWVAGPYVVRVAESHPADVRAWLRALPKDLSAKQVIDLLWVARAAGGDDILTIAVSLAQHRLDSFEVRFQLDALLHQATPEQRASRVARVLIEKLLTAMFAGSSRSHDTYMAAEQVNAAVAATAGGEPDPWLTMLAHRAREVAEHAEPLHLRILLPLDELQVRRARSPLDLITAALRDAATAAGTAGLNLDTRLARLRILPEPLAAQIAANTWPSPEELTLVRRIFADDASRDTTPIVAALGPPPTAEQIHDLAAYPEEQPDGLVRAHRWLVAIPHDASPDWHAADVELQPHLGLASNDGVMMRVNAGTFGPSAPPIPAEDLRLLTPAAAAARVAAWRPQPEASFMDPGAVGLAATLREVIEADLPAWLTADCVAVARALEHPRYVATFIDALIEHADQLPDPGAAVALADLVLTKPWDPDNAPEPALAPGLGWAHVTDVAIKLLGRLGKVATLPPAADDRAWTLIVAAVRARAGGRADIDDEIEPLTAALRYRWTQALDAALMVGSGLDGVPDDRLLTLLDEILALTGTDGRHAHALLASRWAWLRARAPQWFAVNGDRIFGDDAAMDLYLQYGSVSRAILGEQCGRIIAALGRGQREPAAHHLLHGMLFALPDYEPTTLAAVLEEAGVEAIADAARWMGTAFTDADADDVDMTPVAALWRALLDRQLPPAAYAEFGWLTLNDHLDENTWLDLTDATVSVADNNLSAPDQVAERAARTPADPRAASIVARLLAGDPAAWELQRIGAVGLEIATVAPGPVAHQLRERLLERGFYEARHL